MSQYTVEITELNNTPEHWTYAQGKIAQLKLMLKNKKAELARQNQIKEQSKAPVENDELRRRALVRATQARMVTL